MNNDLGMTFIGIGFGSLLFVAAISIGVYGVVWLIKQCNKSKACHLFLSMEYRDIWLEAVVLAKYEKEWGIITEEQYKEQIEIHINRMLSMTMDEGETK